MFYFSDGLKPLILPMVALLIVTVICPQIIAYHLTHTDYTPEELDLSALHLLRHVLYCIGLIIGTYIVSNTVAKLILYKILVDIAESHHSRTVSAQQHGNLRDRRYELDDMYANNIKDTFSRKREEPNLARFKKKKNKFDLGDFDEED